MALLSIDNLRQRLGQLDTIPSVPAILFPLLRHLEAPVEQVNMQRIVDLISHDKSLTAQCLHMANSPLFGRWRKIDSVRGAVVSLGVGRVREIAMSCCILAIIPKDYPHVDPRIFWEHSLGVALVSRRLARQVGYSDPEKAYVAGLLHDLGIIANLLLIPDEFRSATEMAVGQKIGLAEAEISMLGISHCVSGGLLAAYWHLMPDVCEVIRHHHEIKYAALFRSLNALVHIADVVCRRCGLGYGYEESVVPEADPDAWYLIREECKQVHFGSEQRLMADLVSYVQEVKRLVSVLFRCETSRVEAG